MKIEILFVGGSIDIDRFEGDHIRWLPDGDGYLSIYVGTEEEHEKVASYPEGRVVRVRVIDDPSVP